MPDTPETIARNCAADLEGYLSGKYSRPNFERRWRIHHCPLPIPPVKGSELPPPPGGGGGGTGGGGTDGTESFLPTSGPPVIGFHNVVKGEDPAAAIPIASLRFSPPSIRSANNVFTWPVGTEGFRRFGSATLGIHKYMGDANVAVQVIHLDEAHIEMTGTFAGLTSARLMELLEAVITAGGSKDLFVPGVFSRIQRVFTENYDFTHPADDRTHSIDYTISFVRTTVGASVPPSTTTKAGIVVQADKGISGSPRNTSVQLTAQSENVYTVVGTAQSLREISAVVYGTGEDWTKLIDLNRELLDIYNPGVNLLAFQLPTMRLPLGTQIVF